MNKSIFFILIFTIFVKHSYAMENTMILKLKNGDVVIELFKDSSQSCEKISRSF